MRSISKRSCLILLMTILASGLLTGCGGSPTKPDAKADQQTGDAAGSKAVAGSSASKGVQLPPLALIPNPYLKNKVNVPSKAKEEFAKAQAAMKAKKYKTAAGLWTLMTETYPKLSGPYVNLGIASWRLDNVDEAENAFTFAIETNKHNMDAYTQLGVLYREQGKFAEAEKVYLAALEVWPHHLDSVLNIGVLYDLYMGRFEEALHYYVLSQRIVSEPNRKVKGWIVDLERRIAAQKG